MYLSCRLPPHYQRPHYLLPSLYCKSGCRSGSQTKYRHCSVTACAVGEVVGRSPAGLRFAVGRFMACHFSDSHTGGEVTSDRESPRSYYTLSVSSPTSPAPICGRMSASPQKRSHKRKIPVLAVEPDEVEHQPPAPTPRPVPTAAPTPAAEGDEDGEPPMTAEEEEIHKTWDAFAEGESSGLCKCERVTCGGRDCDAQVDDYACHWL